MTDTPVEEMSFEAAMAELEKVLGQLERGDVALDESISLYERGAKLKKYKETLETELEYLEPEHPSAHLARKEITLIHQKLIEMEAIDD